MKEIFTLLQLALLLGVWIQLFGPSHRARLIVTAIASGLFLFYSQSLIHLLALVGWLAGVYGLCFFYTRGWINGKVLVSGYVTSIVVTFLMYKLGVFESGDYRALVNRSVPLGFSFVMFFSIAYVIDIVAGKTSQIPPLRFFSTGLFFPVLPAGPFFNSRYPETHTRTEEDNRGVLQAYGLISLGIFKVALSGYLVNPAVFSNSLFVYDPNLTQFHPLSIMWAGSLYLYANFSGYSDIVVGIGHLVGVPIPINFRFPFWSRSMAEYWRSWHMSLGTWFKEYVFFPAAYRLGSVSLATFFTFLLIGLWHDINIKFIVYAVVNAGLVAFLLPQQKNYWIGVPMTFFVMLFVNSLFLSADLSSFTKLVSAILAADSKSLPEKNIYFWVASAVVCFYLVLCERSVDRLDSAERVNSNALMGINFIFANINLFMGLVLGISSVDLVYVGY